MDQRLLNLVKFDIKETNDKEIRANMLVSPQFPSFEGHFPENPILPAVSIIDISLHLISQLNVPVSYANIRMKKSKFAGQVRPGQNVEISAKNEAGQSWKVVWLSEDKAKLAQLLMII